MIIRPYAVNMSLSPVETFHETSLQLFYDHRIDGYELWLWHGRSVHNVADIFLYGIDIAAMVVVGDGTCSHPCVGVCRCEVLHGCHHLVDNVEIGHRLQHELLRNIVGGVGKPLRDDMQPDGYVGGLFAVAECLPIVRSELHKNSRQIEGCFLFQKRHLLVPEVEMLEQSFTIGIGDGL